MVIQILLCFNYDLNNVFNYGNQGYLKIMRRLNICMNFCSIKDVSYIEINAYFSACTFDLNKIFNGTRVPCLEIVIAPMSLPISELISYQKNILIIIGTTFAIVLINCRHFLIMIYLEHTKQKEIY
uniref:Uncharacterized protein n=1 Tax=Staphylococcus aureus TaxID=1280 RepID=Q936F9_STAAU|nr:unknown [Staphylococcus aureus]